MDNSELDCFHLGVKALIRNPKKQILLLKRDHKIKNIYWDLPGGRLQKGESALKTLKREVDEETGLRNINPQLITTFLTDIRNEKEEIGLILSIYLCDLTEDFFPQLSDEHVNFEWVSATDCIRKLDQYPSLFQEALLHLI
jgi:8-oxo-dGTP pyrophosphatase MutT (NUDIX family)